MKLKLVGQEYNMSERHSITHPALRIDATGRVPLTDEVLDLMASTFVGRLNAIADKTSTLPRKRRETAYDKGYKDGWHDAMRSLVER